MYRVNRATLVVIGLNLIVLVFALTQLHPASAQSPLFAPPPGPPVKVARGSGRVHLVDMDRDGHLDLVTKSLTNRNVTILFGDGKGRFVRTIDSSLTSNSLDAIALGDVGDVNNDGALDLVGASKEGRDERVHIFLANRKGGFDMTSASPLLAGVSKENCCYKPRLRFADLNEDGNLDLIYANGRRSTLESFLGDGRGGFSPRPSVQLEADRTVYSFELGDVDGDGHLDLVTASSVAPDSGSGHLITRRGDGEGGFADAIGPTLSVLPDPRVETVADLNGDQRPDVVLSHGRMNILTILLNKGDGTFTPAHGSPVSVGMPAVAVVAADINGDKNADLIVAIVSDTAPFASKIAVLLGDGHGGFTPAHGSPFPAAPGAYSLAVGDVNEDGKLDIVASSFESDTVTVLLGQ